MKVIRLTTDRLDEFKNLRLLALKIEPEAFGNSIDELSKQDGNFWQEELSSPNKRIWYGAEIEGRVIGLAEVKYAALRKFSHIAKISGVFILPEFRKKGIGMRLLKKVVAEIKSKKGIRKIKLTVNANKDSAVRLYSKLGFKKVGRMKEEFKIGKKYYDAYLMELLV